MNFPQNLAIKDAVASAVRAEKCLMAQKIFNDGKRQLIALERDYLDDEAKLAQLDSLRRYMYEVEELLIKVKRRILIAPIPATQADSCNRRENRHMKPNQVKRGRKNLERNNPG